MKHLIHRSSIFSRLLPLILSMVVFQAAVYLFVFWQGVCSATSIRMLWICYPSKPTIINNIWRTK